MTPRLVLVDVDGTLVTGDRRVTERTRAAFARARAAGIRVSLATGRTFESALPFARAIGADAPLVVYNGARVQAVDGTVLREWRLDAELARVALEEVTGADLHVSLYQDEAIYIAEWNGRARASAEKDGVTMVPVGDLRALLSRPPLKLMLIGEPDFLDGLSPRLLSAFERRGLSPPVLVRSEPTYLEVWNAGASKGVAAAFVAERLGVAMHQVAAFGDSLNDVDLVRKAGVGVAMGNAHESLKRVAALVAPTNEDDGVAQVLERWLEGASASG